MLHFSLQTAKRPSVLKEAKPPASIVCLHAARGSRAWGEVGWQGGLILTGFTLWEFPPTPLNTHTHTHSLFHAVPNHCPSIQTCWMKGVTMRARPQEFIGHSVYEKTIILYKNKKNFFYVIYIYIYIYIYSRGQNYWHPW